MRGVVYAGGELEIDQVPGERPYVNFEWLEDGSLEIEVSGGIGRDERITLAPERAAKAAKKIRKHLKR